MKKKSSELSLEGELLESEKRNLTPRGNSKGVNIPKSWLEKLRATVFVLDLVKDEDGELCIVISKPKDKRD